MSRTQPKDPDGLEPMPTPVVVRRVRRDILRWYDANARRFPWRVASASTYARIVSEVLLQRTRADVVASYLPGFLRRFPSWRSLAAASFDEMQAVLRPLGLWRVRAVALQGLAAYAASHRGRFPAKREWLEKIPAVGQYVGNAVRLFAHRIPAPLLDGSFARFVDRCFDARRRADLRYDDRLQRISWMLVDAERSRDLSWAILDLAAMVCVPKQPRCHECPVRGSCSYRNSATVTPSVDGVTAMSRQDQRLPPHARQLSGRGTNGLS
jgi:A/G-specific adenine glycosylase